MEELKPYMVEFDKNGAIKVKEYPVERQPIVIITHNEYTFFVNNRVQRV